MLPDEPDLIAPEFRELAQETASGPTGLLKTGAISTGRGLFKIGRALGLADPETDAEKIAFEALGEERPITTTVGEVVGESLPFLPAGVVAGGIASTPLRTAAVSGLGAVEGGLVAKGEGRNIGEQFRSAGIGGTLAGALEIGLPYVGRFARKIYQRVKGTGPAGPLITSAGTPTQELTQVLGELDLTFDDLTDAAVDTLRKQPELADPEQATRKAFLEGQGLTGEGAPTTAQVTRDAAEFQAQQEAAKTSGRVRTRLETQQGILTNRFDETIAGTGGQPVTSGSSVADHILNKSTELDNEISGLYNIAKKRLTDNENVNLSKTFAKLKSMKPSNTLMKGVPEALLGEAKRLGILDPDTGISRLATVEEAEILRKFSNKIFNSTNDFGKIGLRDFRNFIDDDVTKSAGEDIFNKARQTKAKFEADLSRSKISKFDKKKDSIIRDILDNKVDPERLLEQTVLAKKYRGSDLKQLKKYMSTGTDAQIKAGKAAFDDLRAETFAYIKDNSFVGPEDSLGNRNLSRNAIQKTLKRIGNEKMSALFTGAEIKFLRDIENVAKLLEPVRGTALGRGPSAQAVDSAIESLKRRVDKIPGLNIFVDIKLGKDGSVLKGKPILKKQNLLPTKSEAADLGKQAVITTAVAGRIKQEDNKQ